MTQPNDQPSAAAFPSRTGDVESTGHAVVDEVLRSLDGVGARALEEQVPMFEAAHARLRAVLADAGDAPTA